ncbi:MAG: hypothetical protein KAH22_08090 [Thiotrichaceae bacterium]|nr:hypothetical protein [Thiotrichaceae bacterium]
MSTEQRIAKDSYVQFQAENGDVKNFHVTAVGEKTITIDSNHPFASQTVIFHVKVTNIRKATDKELIEGTPTGAEAIGDASEAGATLH